MPAHANGRKSAPVAAGPPGSRGVLNSEDTPRPASPVPLIADPRQLRKFAQFVSVGVGGQEWGGDRSDPPLRGAVAKPLRPEFSGQDPSPQSCGRENEVCRVSETICIVARSPSAPPCRVSVRLITAFPLHHQTTPPNGGRSGTTVPASPTSTLTTGKAGTKDPAKP